MQEAKKYLKMFVLQNMSVCTHKAIDSNLHSVLFDSTALFWELPALPHTYVENLSKKYQMLPWYRTVQASMTIELALIKLVTR